MQLLINGVPKVLCLNASRQTVMMSSFINPWLRYVSAAVTVLRMKGLSYNAVAQTRRGEHFILVQDEMYPLFDC